MKPGSRGLGRICRNCGICLALSGAVALCAIAFGVNIMAGAAKEAAPSAPADRKKSLLETMLSLSLIV
jgi:hypothetical protein